MNEKSNPPAMLGRMEYFMIDIQNCKVNGIKHFGQRYYVETIGNITDEAVQKYIKEQAEESRREDSRSTAL